ncbi:MAG: fatty acid desaturase family protein [Alphaproteobacteria bacterium]|nr:fatty acid desaturase family protein [Alphaproteobacteria bacterium]MBL7096887.1 fatty acid desaturase family protein [Alphaproteobacteria bacterium]
MNVARFDPHSVFSAAEIESVRARSDVRGMLAVVHAWAVIGLAMAAYAVWPNPLTFVAAVVVIGSRQLGLAILMHDAAHGVLMKTRWLNECVGQWLLAYPTMGDMISYRHYHLVHHRRTQQPDDPDLSLSAKFPITRTSFRRKMIRDLTGQTGFKQRKAQFQRSLGKPGDPFAKRAKDFWDRIGRQYLVQLIILALMTAFGKPHYFLMFWVLPNITWHMAITRIRNIAEHAMVPDNDDVFRNARTTYASWWVRALVAPYWVNYHVDHHLLFYVPCYNLPKLHALLLARGLGEKMEIQPNYWTMLKLATSKPEKSGAVPAAA